MKTINHSSYNDLLVNWLKDVVLSDAFHLCLFVNFAINTPNFKTEGEMIQVTVNALPTKKDYYL